MLVVRIESRPFDSSLLPSEIGEKVEYVHQTIRGLTLGHFVAPDDLRTFSSDGLTVLQRSMVTVDGLQAEAAIIGESHFIHLTGTDFEFVELLACIDITDSGFRPTYVARSLEDTTVWDYSTKSKKVQTHVKCHRSLNAEERQRMFDESMPEGEILGLCEFFPGPLRPRTAVKLYESNGGIVVCTIHEYVMGDRIDMVSSRTLIATHQTEVLA